MKIDVKLFFMLSRKIYLNFLEKKSRSIYCKRWYCFV